MTLRPDTTHGPRAGGAPGRGRSDPGGAPLVVASHMRSGTHLTIDLLRRNVPCVSARYLNLDLLMRDHGAPLSLGAFEREVDRLSGLPLLKTHAPARAEGWFPPGDERSRRALELLAGARIVYVVRDGRDVMVSLYYYMQRYSGRVRAQRFEQFLRDRDDFFQQSPEFRGLDRVSAWVRHVEGWLEREDVVVVRYEDLLERLAPTLLRALAELALPAPAQVAAVQVPAGIPARVLRRVLAPLLPRRVSTAIVPRRGVVGDAARHFSAADEDFFRERADALLGRLGTGSQAA